MLSALVALTLATHQVGVPGVWAVAVHGDYLASAYDEKYVDLWFISTGKRVKRLKYAGFSPTDENSSAKIVSLDFSPDGSLLAGGSEEPDNGYAPMWEISSGREVAQLG